MPIYNGSDLVVAVYNGEDEVIKVYNGDDLVHDSSQASSAYDLVAALADFHLKLDDLTGSTAINSGTGGDGDATFVSPFTAEDGSVPGLGTVIDTGKAIEFVGTEHIRGPNIGLGEADQTLHVLVTTVAANGYIARIGAVHVGGLGLYVNDGKAQVVIGTQSFTPSTKIINDGVEHAITAVYTAATDIVELFVDSESVFSGTRTSGFFTADQPIVLAARDNVAPAVALNLACTLDEVMYFHQVLTATQIDTLASAVVSEAPRATNMSQSHTYTTGDVAVALDDIYVSDINVGETITARLTLNDPATGALSTGTYGATTSTYVAGVWEAVGTVADVNAALAAVEYQPIVTNETDTTITTHVEDLAATGPADGTIVLDVNPVLAGYYVDPDVLEGAGVGTWENPWNLRSVLEGDYSGTVAGSTVWMRGGYYNLSRHDPGQGGVQIYAGGYTLRSMQGEWAVIDMWAPGADFGDCHFKIHPSVADLTLQDFEIYSSSTLSRYEVLAVDPKDDDVYIQLNRGQIYDDGVRTRYINLISHDLQNTLGNNSGVVGGEIYGTMVFNSGWIGGTNFRGHEHGMYLQNASETEVKTVENSVIHNSMGYGLHCYASGTVSVPQYCNNLHFKDLISFNNGDRNLLVGTEYAPMTPGPILERVHSYAPESRDNEDRIGWASRITDPLITMNDCYLASGWLRFVTFTSWSFSNNTVFESPGVTNDWDGVGGSQPTGWTKVDREAATGTHDKVHLVANKYEAGRAFLTIYNFSRATSVDVDLSQDFNADAVLADGTYYEVYSVFDYMNAGTLGVGVMGTPVIPRTLFSTSSPTISIPMGTHTAPLPLGDLTGPWGGAENFPRPSPATQDSEFMTFIIRTVP